MYKFLKNLSCLLCIVMVVAGCRKKALDAYYDAPANALPSIYTTLQNRGNFSNYLALIDKSGYKATLSTGSYYTVFAPNDAAFQAYFTQTGKSLDALTADSLTVGKIVRYSLVLNQFKTDHLSDYQSPSGYIANTAFKRRTAYYDGYMLGPIPVTADPNGVYYSENRNNGGYLFGDNNNKYIPYFTTAFMAQAGLTGTDYNFFYPSSTYSGFNVANAKVVNADIGAQNGVIHEVDQVVIPLPSIEQQLAVNTNYSAFRNIYETYLTSYLKDANYTRLYATRTSQSNNAYVKLYNSGLAYALGNENYLKVEDQDAQKAGYTLFAPNNTATNTALGGAGVVGSLLEFYGTIAGLPSAVLLDFMNAHMFQSMVWPSKFTVSSNLSGEAPTFTTAANVVDKTLCSNGIFYGVNQVQRANVFNTVYARAYLDPAYSISLRLIDLRFKSAIVNPGIRYTLLLIPDVVWRAAGFDYSLNLGAFTQTSNGATISNSTVRDLMIRLQAYGVVSTPNNELNNISGSGIVETFQGEYIRYYNGAFYNAGNVENNTSIGVSGFRDYSNGRVYYLTSVPPQAAKPIATEIANNSGTAAAPGPYYDFNQYLISSSAYNPSDVTAVPQTGTGIVGLNLGAPYTIFIPTRAAMQQAVIDGYLPGVTAGTGAAKTFVSFTYNPSDAPSRALVANFIFYHIVSGSNIAFDGKKSGAGIPTALKDIAGNPYNVSVVNNGTLFTVQDVQNRVATVIAPIANPNTIATTTAVGQTSNYLTNYTLTHQINNYLRPF